MSELRQKPTSLLVPQEQARHKLQVQIEKARLILSSLTSGQTNSKQSPERIFEKAQENQEKWAKFSIHLLKSLFSDHSPADEFGDHWINYSLHGDQEEEFLSWMYKRIADLESIIERLRFFPIEVNKVMPPPISTNETGTSKDIFIVHGHDDAVKHEIARFINNLGLNPIILHEKPDKGRTIIEKFEENTQVCFAIILLTPDDIGYPKEDPTKTKNRARQNVIFELGFFLGKLGRHKVCALKKGDIEIPTDYSGVLFKTLDDPGAWKFQLAKEIKEAGIEIDLNNAF